jgi:hypothetical protein
LRHGLRGKATGGGSPALHQLEDLLWPPKNAGVRNYFMERDLDLMRVSMPYLDAS